MRKQDEKYFDDLTETELLALCIEREAGGEAYEGKVAVGTVVLERVDHRDWDGKTIKEVILKPWQFSWTMPEAGAAYYDQSVELARNFQVHIQENESLQTCMKIADGMITGAIPRDPDLAGVHCCEYVAGKYRKHMDAHPMEPCNRWWQRMKLFKVIARHEFYIKG
ncbi:MAG: cell wall hydrolase [Smithella sp.]